VPFHSLDNQQGLLAAIRANPAILMNSSEPATTLQQQRRLFAVHRLDTGTSGMVCFATSAHVAGLVAKAFRCAGS
jgi:23S rRNA-/tRNA-specific pseudouridylate synthase